MEKAKDLDDGDKLRFASFMNESPQKVDNKLDLKIVSKYFDK
jgi:hypothetical protein